MVLFHSVISQSLLPSSHMFLNPIAHLVYPLLYAFQSPLSLKYLTPAVLASESLVFLRARVPYFSASMLEELSFQETSYILFNCCL